MEEITDEIKNIFVEANPDIPVLPLLTEQLINMKRAYAEVDEKANLLKKEIESLSQQIFNTMLQQSLKSFKREDGVTISAYSEEVYYVDKEKKKEFLEEARTVGWDSFIKEDFSWRSLQTLMRELKSSIENNLTSARVKNDNLVKLEHIQRYLIKNKKNNIRVLGLKK